MRRLPLILIIILFIGFVGFQFTETPPHGSDFKISCDVCHSSKGWKIDYDVYSFNHDSTEFELTGLHASAGCRKCHPSLIFSEAQSECSGCHMDVHSQTVGLDCERCHEPLSWLVPDINGIHQASRFPLLGEHALAGCEECHQTENYLRFDPIGIECIDCHRYNYITASSPNHITAGYSQDCSECHIIYAFEWGLSGFNHNFFPLTQGHHIADCQACHTNPEYSNTPNDCFSCHEQDYNAAIDPAHSGNGFDTDCSVCHTTVPGWSPASFPNHNEFFEFVGAHIQISGECLQCHTTGYVNTPNTCIGCHTNDFNTTSDPPHVSSGFSTECLVCHNQNAWEPATFDHNDIYALTGAHSTATCAACHQGSYTNTPNTCYACHTSDYAGTNDPPHESAGFSTDCETCHTTATWDDATFDHNIIYPFTGAHIEIANNCQACHQAGYTNTPNTCYGCHSDDYNATNDPPHASSGFSTDCESCHNTSDWDDATFDHDGQFFPIYSGKHDNEWNTCADCHTTPGNYAIFSCIDCHEHNQADMNGEHDEVTNYSWNSAACFDCHPTGVAEDDKKRKF